MSDNSRTEGELMAEELAFARKASGLTRGLSMYDAFGMGLINILPLYAIWFMFMAGLGIFAHANLFIMSRSRPSRWASRLPSCGA